MNKLPGTITHIQQSGAVILVDVSVDGHGFSAMLIDSGTSNQWLGVGAPVSLIFKETEVSLAKDLSGKISMRNRLPCTVQRIDRGELLSNISLRFGNFLIASAITTRSVEWLQLQVGDNVEALIKANEIAIAITN